MCTLLVTEDQEHEWHMLDEKRKKEGTGEMVQQLRTPVALPVNTDAIASTHMTAQKSSSRGANAPSWPP